MNFDRATAARYGFAPNQIDNVLYDAFGQRTVSTIYNPLNQYFVVMEVAPEYWQYPQTLNQIFLSTAAGNATGTQQTQMPGGTVKGVTAASAVARHRGVVEHQFAELERASQRDQRQHFQQQGRQFERQRGQHGGRNHGAAAGAGHATSTTTRRPRSTTRAVSSPRRSRSTCRPADRSARPRRRLRTPSARSACRPAIHGAFAGAAQAYAQSMGTIPLLILAALGVVYIVLGMLYENSIHPLTILSTLPSAGIGATLALLIFGTPFSVIALIGIILLIGIVKKNGIMMVDVAIQLQRNEGMPAKEAIHAAAVVRLRPIMMTTVRRRAGRRAAGDRHRPGRVAAPAARYYRDGRPDPEPGLHAVHHAGDLPVPGPVALQARQMVFRSAVESASGQSGNGYEGMTMKISSKPLAAAAPSLLLRRLHGRSRLPPAAGQRPCDLP